MNDVRLTGTSNMLRIIMALACCITLSGQSQTWYQPAPADTKYYHKPVYSHPQHKAKRTILKNASLIRLETGSIDAVDIVLEDDLISGILLDVRQKDDDFVIDASDKYVLPGLIDAHTHVATYPSYENWRDWDAIFDAVLQSGITTIFDFGGDARYLSVLKRSTLVGDVNGPDIYYSSIFSGKNFFKDPRSVSSQEPYLSGTTPWLQQYSSKTQLPTMFTGAKAIGADFIKLYADLNSNEVRNIVSEAKTQGFPVFSHSALFPSKPSEIALSGVNLLTHSAYLVWEVLELEQDYRNRNKGDYKRASIEDTRFTKLFTQMKNNNVALNPTLFVLSDEEDKTAFQWAVKITKRAFEQGVKIVSGSDRLITKKDSDYKTNLITELMFLNKEVGLPPLEVLRTATINAARALGKNNIGQLEQDKVANLLLLDKNPLEDLNHLNLINYVFKRGKVVLTKVE